MEALNRGAAAEAEQVCEHAVADAHRQGMKCEVHAGPGRSADALIAVAKDIAADVLVVGSRRMSGHAPVRAGRRANKVSHHCPLILLIVDTAAD